MKTFIVIPAYNEENSIGEVISGLNKRGYKDIIVVDDGSYDNTFEVAKKSRVPVYRHFLNCGLGTALSTGIKIALNNGADAIITFDADGQHDPRDIVRVLKPIKNKKADVVIGSRVLERKNMPFFRKIGNFGLDFVTFILFGLWVTDTQSGLRAFSRYAAEKIEIKTTRMEVSSEIIKEIKKKGLRFMEVPIKTIYTDYSMQHSGNSVLNGFRILYKLVLRKLLEK